VKEIPTELGGREFSKWAAHRLSEELDEQVEAWASRSLQEKSYPFLGLDAMHLRVRRQGAVRSTTVMLAAGINKAGQREILGLETAFGETGEAWRRFIRQLKRRGLSGVEVDTSVADESAWHDGLVQALREALPQGVEPEAFHWTRGPIYYTGARRLGRGFPLTGLPHQAFHLYD
jgi:transposase-like protein